MKYYPCKGNIETTGSSIVIKQQWLAIQQQRRKKHPIKL